MAAFATKRPTLTLTLTDMVKEPSGKVLQGVAVESKAAPYKGTAPTLRMVITLRPVDSMKKVVAEESAAFASACDIARRNFIEGGNKRIIL